MPGKGKAVVLIVWIANGLVLGVMGVSVFTALGTASPRLQSPLYWSFTLVVVAWCSILIVLATLLAKGLRWVWITLIVLHVILTAVFPIWLFLGQRSFLLLAPTIVGGFVLYLVTAEPVKAWCSPWAVPASAASTPRPSRY
jgi:hypothetical protein